MTARFSAAFLRIAAGMVTGLLVIAALGAWRLSQGPVALDFMIPYVEQALSRPDQGVTVAIGGLSLTSVGKIELHATRARIRGPDDRTIARVPDLRLGLSARALPRGIVAPTTLDVVGMRVRLARLADGRIRFGLAATDTPEGGDAGAEGLGLLLSDVFQPPDTDKPTGYLERLSISDGSVIVSDAITNSVWRAPDAEITLSRTPTTVTIIADVEIDLAGERQHLETTGGYDLATGETWLEARFAGLRPDLLAELVPGFPGAIPLRMPLDGTVSVGFAPDGRLRSGRFDVAGQDGFLPIPLLSPEPVPVAGVTVQGAITDWGRRLEIERLELALGGHVVEAVGSAREVADGFVADLRFDGVVPSMASASPSLAALAGVDLRLGGMVSLRLDENGAVRDGRYDIEANGGSVTVPDVWPQQIAIVGAAASGAVLENLAGLTFERLTVDLGGPTLRGSGSLRRDGGGMALRAEVTAREVPTNDLGRLWPVGAASGARAWVVENLADGQVDEATAKVAATFPGPDATAPVPAAVTGDLTFTGVTARYWKPLPPFRDVRGSASFTEERFDVTLTGGSHRDISLRDGKIAFTGLDRGGEELADIAVTLAGPMSDIMTVLDLPPLGYAKWLKVDPADLKGSATALLTVKLPLLKSVTLDDIEIGARAQTRGVELPDMAFGQPLTDANLDLDVNESRIAFSGEGSLATVRARLEGVRNFTDDAPVRSRVRLSGTVGDAARRILELDVAPYLTGPVSTQLTMVEDRSGIAALSVSFNFRDAVLALPEADWIKPAASPGRGELELTLRGERPAALRRFAIEAGDLSTAGSASFAAGSGKLQRVEVDRFRLGQRNDFSGSATFAPDGGSAISITGATLDLTPLLDELDEVNGGGSDPDAPAMTISADLAQVWAGGDAPMGTARGIVLLRDGSLRSGEVQARIGAAGSLAFRAKEVGHAQTLALSTDDLGAALRVLGVTDSVVGGRFELSASRDLATPDAPLQGIAEGENLRVTGAPLIARLLAAADLSAPDAGIGFDRLTAPFSLTGNMLSLKPGRIYGAALGITFFGAADLTVDTVDMAGTLVPAYTINRAIGAIPLIGPLLTGEKGSGVFAATYRVTGPIDDPQIRVNPLAALAPGFLRGLFGALTGGGNADWDPNDDPAAEEFPGNLR